MLYANVTFAHFDLGDQAYIVACSIKDVFYNLEHLIELVKELNEIMREKWDTVNVN